MRQRFAEEMAAHAKHSLANMDFRAEGTFNDNGIRGYGRKGMRVFDFGWVVSERGWGT